MESRPSTKILSFMMMNANNSTEEEESLKNSSESGNSTWNGNSSSYGEWEEEDYVGSFHFSLTFQVIVYVLYNAVFVSAVLGNVLVVYVIGSTARLRTVTNYLIGKHDGALSNTLRAF
jgi:hypothetical protein